MSKLKVAILGSGNIGTDLMVKILRSKHLEPTIFIGRNISSKGIAKVNELGIPTSYDGISYIENHPDCCDLVFDATSASSHIMHANILKKLNKIVIDLTPSKIGIMCVPAVNKNECLNHTNVNMVTCGGQASIPFIDAIAKVHSEIDYIEVVSSIASKSAGPATRSNLDEYIHTTENAIIQFSGALKSKSILNLNPAIPCVNMQTTIFARVSQPNIDELAKVVKQRAQIVSKYVPGFKVLVGPMLENSRIVITVVVKGLGDYLPEYAGNLDIINCAAVEMAEAYANH